MSNQQCESTEDKRQLVHSEENTALMYRDLLTVNCAVLPSIKQFLNCKGRRLTDLVPTSQAKKTHSTNDMQVAGTN